MSEHFGCEECDPQVPKPASRASASASRRVRLRCSLRYRQSTGGSPMLISYPFARLEICGDELVFSAKFAAPFSRPKWIVHRSQISKLERTQHGVRFHASGYADPWIAGLLRTKHFLRKLEENGIAVSGPIVPTTWGTV